MYISSIFLFLPVRILPAKSFPSRTAFGLFAAKALASTATESVHPFYHFPTPTYVRSKFFILACVTKLLAL